MDVNKFAAGLDAEKRARLDALSSTEAAKALEGMFSEAELIKAAGSGDAGAMRDILRRVLATEEGRKLAEMLGEVMK
ncbi:MAG TPA: hypothetical protein IAC26_03345 [Candidatus Scatomorpha stercoravium]|nr:hypothetical protein [Candidatus Scatomorpha stercoravium]